jgi:hypothetical protein
MQDHTEHLTTQASAADYDLNYFIAPKAQLVA